MSDSDVRIDLDEETIEETDGVTSEINQLVGLMSKESQDGSEKLDLFQSWLPDSDEYKGKTRITQSQAHSLAAMMNLPRVYDLLGMHIEGFDEFIESMGQDYMQLLTSVVDDNSILDRGSVEDHARHQQMRVLMAVAGVHADMDDASRSLMRRLAAGDDGDE